ncbi:hypothetical protein MUY14_07395 [Amycolatopsis sp. FBCC-B4732]|uniref:hypothetical protein n=1 Tax=Amycolatopsis sp. FBCC-B4732 TaxID=3079339 RepID=UPI001FF30057|nr:hypothetical protein [Amycolatopsis sp. FBCC-B4732]UOX90440.1 hypothetical protein MUY14_07395 [Amycolatopsis sp. FBCC-B4732]
MARVEFAGIAEPYRSTVTAIIGLGRQGRSTGAPALPMAGRIRAVAGARLPARCHRLFGLGLAGLTKLAARRSVAGHEGVRRFVADVLAENAVAGQAVAVRYRDGEPR